MKKLKSTIKNIKFKKNFKVIEPVNLYECNFGNNIFVGPFVEIQKGVRINDNTRISSHSFICEKVIIGKNCFIGHGVMFTNDKFSNGKRAHGDKKKWLPTLIEDNILIGSNSTILPVKIVSGCVIGAGSVVTKDITKKGVYAGNPAKLIKKL
jgi:acetyltransferase-like isoleucine patch superfamily enzyme